ncbi:hypothetical protein HK57_00673 [Aspergillus ustus]|uniref:Alkyl transferase n=1 Tax=Aspergillus ustus TaxID=40382 RepID=A0A0C1C3G2_ASPUT|nr:hypothetical protein HK57_00673 [Aspergillus ustus]
MDLRSYLNATSSLSWNERLLLDIIQHGPVPRHVAIILDGNRRWARERQLPIIEGHRAGVESLLKVLEGGYRCGIRVMTIYVFSIENFKRPKDQVDDLMMLLKGLISAFRLPNSLAQRRGVQVRVVGRIDLLQGKIRSSISHTMKATKNNRSGVLNVCLAYTSRDEITTSIRKTVTQGIPPHLITQQTLTDNMLVEGPPLDILIRTSRTYRLSDFMLWQCHQNTMIEIVDINWPDFGIWKLFLTMLKWQRERAQEDKVGQDAFSSKRRISGVRNGMFVIIFSAAYAVCALCWVLGDVLLYWFAVQESAKQPGADSSG